MLAIPVFAVWALGPKTISIAPLSEELHDLRGEEGKRYNGPSSLSMPEMCETSSSHLSSDHMLS